MLRQGEIGLTVDTKHMKQIGLLMFSIDKQKDTNNKNEAFSTPNMIT